MEINDEFPQMKYKQRFKFVKSRSVNNFGLSVTSFSNKNLRKEDITSKTRVKPFKKNGLIKSKSQKKDMILSDMDNRLFFSHIKNKNVRNFYETVLKSCCKEKEPKERFLKNLFRMNNKKHTLVLKSKDKDKDKDKINNSKNNLINEKTEKKSRTSNSLPYIILSQNNNNNSSAINNDNKKTIFNKSNNKKTQSLFYKDANKNDFNKNNKIIFSPISKSVKKKTIIGRNNLLKSFIISFEKDKEEYKSQKTIDSKK